VYPLVADLTRWTEHLPHYRYVRVLSETNGWTRAAMSARRGLIPVFWHAVQSAEPERRRIHFRHVRGITRGMEVLWTLEPERGGTRANIRHDLVLGWPWIGPWFADRVIGREFIHPIASLTLARFKSLAEAR
ncbi:MAG TPA: SRPBCC family protein, partial [Candidatus Eisenbacteria bacterium]|nr:SRPBCC family protein [Candidatus Eisenbacteria bacterium]